MVGTDVGRMADMMVQALVLRFRPLGFAVDAPWAPNLPCGLAHGLRDHPSPAAEDLGPGQGPVESFPRKRVVRPQKIKRRLPIPVRQAVQ